MNRVPKKIKTNVSSLRPVSSSYSLSWSFDVAKGSFGTCFTRVWWDRYMQISCGSVLFVNQFITQASRKLFTCKTLPVTYALLWQTNSRGRISQTGKIVLIQFEPKFLIYAQITSTTLDKIRNRDAARRKEHPIAVDVSSAVFRRSKCALVY